MKLTLQSILNYPQFYPLVSNAKLPIKTAYKLSRLNDAISKEITFYQTQLREIVEEYCTKDEEGKYVPTEDGRGFRITVGKETECNTRMLELHQLEVELPDITFTIDEFDGVELRVQDLTGIMPFVTE